MFGHEPDYSIIIPKFKNNPKDEPEDDKKFKVQILNNDKYLSLTGKRSKKIHIYG